MINYEATEPGSPAEAAQRGDDLDDLFAEGNQDDAKLQTLAENRTEDNEVVVQFMDQFMNNENFQCHPCGDDRTPQILKTPVMPSKEDVQSHFATHLPYRSWCPICIKAKLKEDWHFRVKVEKKQEGLPIISLDYQDMNEDSKAKQKVIIGKDELTGATFGHYILCKGLGDEWVSKQIVKDIQEFGHGDIILKTDGEPAIVALQNKIQSLRQAKTVPRNPPAYNPQSNGPCEKAVQDVTAHMRALVIGLEARIGAALPDGSPMFQWALEHATFLLNHYNVGKDGMTPFERMTGRKWRRPLAEFGEVVLAKLALRRQQQGKKKKQKRKLACRCIEGVWAGQIARSGEHIIINGNGDAFKCRTIRRLPIEHQWKSERIMKVRGTPRNPVWAKDSDEIECKIVDEEAVEIRRRTQDTEDSGHVRQERQGPNAQLEIPEGRKMEYARRDLRITEGLLKKHGFTPDCEGCSYKIEGRDGHRSHSGVCRQRIYDAMLQDETGMEKLEAVKKRLENKHNADATRMKDAKEIVSPGTPRFGDEKVDEPKHEPEDERHNKEVPYTDIPDLTMSDDEVQENPGDPLHKQKQAFEGDEEDDEMSDDSEDEESKTGDEPASKRQRIRVVNTRKNNIPDEQPKIEEIKQVVASLRAIQRDINVKEIIDKLEQDSKKRMQIPWMKQKATTNANGSIDIAEIYSPPRVTEMAARLGMKSGWSLDLTCVDEVDGQPWDFSRAEKRARAIEKLKDDKPFMLIASPMCTAFCRLQNLFNYPKMAKENVEALISEAMNHLKFAIEMCMMQHKAGRLFLFEHPSTATSWQSQTLQMVANLDGVHRVNFDFCALGMTTKTKDGKVAKAKKRTTVLTNSDAIATILREAQCRKDHTHQHLLEGRAGPCQEYTESFCRLICEGVRRELDTVKWRNKLQKVLDVSKPFGQLMSVQAKLEAMAVPPEEEPFKAMYEYAEFIDDISGLHLDKELAIKARIVEMDFFRRMKVYTKVKREPWMKIISTKWIDTNKGDAAEPNIRARLVGREIKRDKRDDLFAATPPLESLRMIVSICASHQHKNNPKERYVMMSNDVKRAYFYAPSTRPIYIIIPDEDWEEGDEVRVGKLNLSLYGTRDAAMNWTNTYTDLLRDIGFIVGKASPCNFHHPRGISLTVHGDDFSSTGTEDNLKWLDAQLKSKFEIKTEFLGPAEHHAKQLRILNRIITWSADGITYEADQRHAEIIIESLCATKTVSTPGCRNEIGRAGPPNGPCDGDGKGKTGRQSQEEIEFRDEIVENGGQMLEASEASQFRALAARANYLAQDRADIQYAVKEIARRMAKPRHEDWCLLKRLARYLRGSPRAAWMYYWQSSPSNFDVYVDADWAGCKATCRSTSGGAAMHGWHTIKSWSTTQAVVAMSSGESELYSLTKGSAQALGLLSLAADLGFHRNARVHTDASATLGIINRQGLGKLRHINVQYLWLQERTKQGDLKVYKVAGQDNPADLLTKNLPAEVMLKHSKALSLEFPSGRADLAPSLSRVGFSSGDRDNWCNDGMHVTRRHVQPRWDLFTPSRVDGQPPIRKLAATRITEGVFCKSGEKFRVVDNWKSQRNSHRNLQKSWIGTTQFLLRTSEENVEA